MELAWVSCGLLVLIFLLCFASTEEDTNLEENDFSWGDYLEETGTRAVPHVSFRHVGRALYPFCSVGGREGGKGTCWGKLQNQSEEKTEENQKLS